MKDCKITHAAPEGAAGEPETIDTYEFRNLLEEYDDAASSHAIYHARKALIDYIDSKLAHPAAPVQPTLIEKMREMLGIQGASGNWNCDPYMHGIYNGMEYMLAMVEGREPAFRDAPTKWLSSKLAVQPVVVPAPIEILRLALDKAGLTAGGTRAEIVGYFCNEWNRAAASSPVAEKNAPSLHNVKPCVPSDAQVQADEAELYRDLTGDAMKLGHDGVPAALDALREAKVEQQAAPEPLAYAIFRGGEQVAVERSKRQAESWVDAQIVPLSAAPAGKAAGEPLTHFGFCDIDGDNFIERPDGEYVKFADVEHLLATQASTRAAERDAAIAEGLELAARYLDKQRQNIDQHHAYQEPDTGAWVFDRPETEEYSNTLAELAEEIRALKSTSSAASQTKGDE